MPRRARVLYFAVEDVDYPRNVRVRNFLEERGVDVVIVPRPLHLPKYREYLALLRAAWRFRSGFDVVILAEFSSNVFPISWLAARLNHAVHVVDFFVGKYETLVEDRGNFAIGHWRAQVLLLLDKAALRSADVAFTDTGVRAAKFARLSGDRTRVLSLPVGSAPMATETIAERDNDGVLELIYFGHYIPLHGVEVLVRALIAASATIPIHVLMVGEGISKQSLIDEVREAKLSAQIEFIGYLRPDALKRAVSGADVVLGIFGTSPKAETVIANKVWQGLYAGKIVVTRRSDALAELADIAQSRLVQVDAGSAGAIVTALRDIATSDVPNVGSASDIAARLELHVHEQFSRAFSDMAFDALRI